MTGRRRAACLWFCGILMGVNSGIAVLGALAHDAPTMLLGFGVAVLWWLIRLRILSMEAEND